MIDIDAFKAVNDDYGHVVGDRLLQSFAQRLMVLMRTSDVLARWGGEEFLLICRGTDRAGAVIFGQRIVDSVSDTPFELGAGISLRKTCSVGWAPFPWAGDGVTGLTPDNVIELADHALYLAKHGGRHQSVGILPSDLASKAPAALRMEVLRTYPPDLVRIVRTLGQTPAVALPTNGAGDLPGAATPTLAQAGGDRS
jgi:diguanylate cyclase (GGDEF)-like protein